MIDALEISIPLSVQPRLEVWNSFKENKLKDKSSYHHMRDCRPQSSLMVFYGHRRPIAAKLRHYRLKFDDVRVLSAADLIAGVQSLFPLSLEDVRRLPIMRVDFAADVAPTVEWFREHFYVKFKRESSEYVDVKLEPESYNLVQKTTRDVETLVFGKKPDRYSVYDKVEEVHARGSEPLQLKPTNVTRVERQCRRIALPEKMRTFGGFLDHAISFDPFENIVILEGEKTPDFDGLSARDWLLALGVNAAINRYGLEGARRESARRSERNETLEKHLAFAIKSEKGVTKAQITEAYRRSARFRLNQPENGVYPMGGLVQAL